MRKHKSKIVLFIITLVIVGIWMSFYSAPLDPGNLPDTSNSKPISEPSPISAGGLTPTKTNTNLNIPHNPLKASSTPNVKPKVLTGNPHFDQMTPGMQQALKDSLLLEGPKETYTRADGSVVLPSNGRFTQMPVAVQMPDGTIKIQEYSNIPKPILKLTPAK